MAWEWSHTAEAYENVREQIEALHKGELEVIYAEWKAESKHELFDDTEGINREWRELYDGGLEEAVSLNKDVLMEFVWERTQEQRTCENGGHRAWVCPTGCHTVPFDPVENKG